MFRRALLAVVVIVAARDAMATVAVDLGDEIIVRIREVRGQLYGASQHSLYKLQGESLARICCPDVEDYSKFIGQLESTDDAAWYQLAGELYRVKDGKITLFMRGVNSMATDTRGLVVCQHTKLFRVINEQVRPVAAPPFWGSTHLSRAGGRVWFSDNGKTYVIDNTAARKVVELFCTPIELRGRAFLSCGAGPLPTIYRTSAEAVPSELFYHCDLGPVDAGDIWIGSRKEAIRLRDVDAVPEPRPIPGIPISHTPGRTWFANRHATYCLTDAGTVTQFANEPAHNIVESAGIIYYSTDSAVYAVRGSNKQLVIRMEQLGFDDALNDLRNVNDHVFAAGDAGAFEIDGTTARRLTSMPISDVFFQSGHLWLAGQHTYRVDDDVDIVAGIKSSESWWKRILDRILPGRTISAGNVRIEPRYARKSDGRDPYSKTYQRRFFTVLSTDRDKFDQQFKNNEFKTASENIADVDGGAHTLYYAARDAAGNTFTFEQKLNVIPGPAAGAVILWLLGAIAAALVLLLAPWVSWCQSLVLNPFIQKYGSFGSLKLILSIVPAARRHLLRRYRRELSADLDATAKQFVIPAPELEPLHIEQQLRTSRRLLIKGRSGIGKSAVLRYLTWFAARHPFVERVTPIFIPVARYRGKTMDRAIADQLAVYGHLSDRDSELLSWFIDEGPFLILFDGLNEVDAETRIEVRRFVDRHWKRNYFALASQEAYEFDDLPSISLAPLGDAEIRRFLTSRLGLRATDAMVKTVLEHRDVYGIAQNLEFVVDLIERGKPVPATANDLYSAILDPIVVSAVDGTIDYSQPLSKRAFDMIRTHEIYVDAPDVDLPAGFLSDLRKYKLVIQRDDKTYFTHNLVRDFLAACYLRSNWKNLIPDQTIDTDWRATLDLLARSLDSEELHALLRVVLVKNRIIAGELFNAAPPEKRNPWGESFEREYGRAALAH